MKTLIATMLIICSVQIGFAQTGKIDLSKDPKQGTNINKGKSNAELLRDSDATRNAKDDDAQLEYNSDASMNNGTYRKATSTSTIQADVQPEVMNTTIQHTKIGNTKVESATYYDNSGKIRSSGTTIKLGEK